jgi:hypothetical protein
MAYCTTCLDGPEDRNGVVMEWGDTDGKSFVESGQAWGEENLIGRPAILDMPVGKGHVVSFNFNPMHAMNRGDQRLLWNALLNWQQSVEQEQTAESLTPPLSQTNRRTKVSTGRLFQRYEVRLLPVKDCSFP